MRTIEERRDRIVMTTTMRMVLRDLLSIHGETYGFEMCKQVGLGHGTLYPIIERLKWAGVLDMRLEEKGEGVKLQRRRRNMICLTDSGRAWAETKSVEPTNEADVEREACIDEINELARGAIKGVREAKSEGERAMQEHRLVAYNTAALVLRMRGGKL